MTKSSWNTLLPLFCILVIDAMSFGIVIPVLGPLLLETTNHFLASDTPLNLRTLYYSLCLGLPTAFMFFGAPLLSDISDQIGRKKALLIALLGIVFSCLLSACGVVVGSIFLLIVGRCILGLMDSSESVAKAAMADMSCSPKEKVLNLSLAGIAGTVGFIVGPMVGGFVASYLPGTLFSYTTPFLVAASLAFINAIILLFLFHETYQPTVKKKINIWGSFKNLASAFSDKRIRLLALVFFCMQFAWGTYFQSVSILLVKAFQYDPKHIGLFLSFLSLCFIIALTVIIRILVKFVEQPTIVIVSLGFVTVGSVIISIVHREIGPWLSVIPMSMGIGLGYNTILSLFSDAVDKDSQGRIMGVSVGIFSMAWLISSIMGGLISSINLYLPYLIEAVFAFVGFYAAFYIRQTSQE